MENNIDYKDPTHVLNRQINYTIIRKLWKYIKGSVESENQKDNLYTVFPFTRNAYTLLVSGNTYQTPKINKTRRRKLEETGVSVAVFTGEVMLTLTSITRDEWDIYFKCRYPDPESKDSNTDSKQKYKSYNKDDTLREMNNRLLNEFKSIKKYQHDSDIFKLYYYICNGIKYDGDESKYILLDCLEVFSTLTFNQWDLLDATQLKTCETFIEKQLKMVKTLHAYKEYKKFNRNKQPL